MTRRPPNQPAGREAERAEALQAFGYSGREAGFLAAAALLGGYFLRRQARAWGGGGFAAGLVRKAAACGHARPAADRSLFRVRGANLHAALGLPEEGGGPLRARRRVKQGLLALDYYLAHRAERPWLLAPADKSAYFGALGIAPDCLPAGPRTRRGQPRRFADGFPILAADGIAPVTFSYAHAGATAGGLQRLLATYAPLGAALAERGQPCSWTVLAESPEEFPRLRSAWRSWRSGTLRRDAERECFALRLAVRRGAWHSLDREAVERYAHLQAELADPDLESRYRAWLAAGAPPRQPGAAFAAACGYQELWLDRDYRPADAVGAQPAPRQGGSR